MHIPITTRMGILEILNLKKFAFIFKRTGNIGLANSL